MLTLLLLVLKVLRPVRQVGIAWTRSRPLDQVAIHLVK